MQLAEKISKNVIHKLCLIAAAKQVSGLVYNEVRLIILNMTEKLAKAYAFIHPMRIESQCKKQMLDMLYLQYLNLKTFML